MLKYLVILVIISSTFSHPSDTLKFLNSNSAPKVFDIQSSPSFLSQITDPKFLDGLSSKELPRDHSCEERTGKKIDPASASPYFFLPSLKARVLPNNQEVTWSNGCYGKNTAKITKFSKEEIVISLNHEDRKSYFCEDVYLVSSFDFNFLHFTLTSYDKSISIKNLTDDQIDTIMVNGIKFHTFCQSIKESVFSILMTVKLFLGGISDDPNAWITFFSSHVPEYMKEANINFLTDLAQFNFKKRTTDKKLLEIDPKNIHSGDFVAIRRWDGVDPIIMWGSGSRIGHTAIAMWEDNELYIYESQDGWYWPRHGIQKNKWDYWIQHAVNADFEVSILPLRKEYRDKFDVNKALKKYESYAGLDYGYRNFLFGWIDTPDKNLPYWIDFDILISLFGLIEKVVPSVVKMIIGEALNQRMGTKDLGVNEIASYAARQKIPMADVLAMPELEEYQYSNGHNFVCSAFVTAMFKAGGLFDDMTILPSEFGPNDVYMLNIFETNPDNIPEICRVTDPSIPYCQLTGEYLMELPGFNTVKPYSHMNERCSTLGPAYIRPDGC